MAKVFLLRTRNGHFYMNQGFVLADSFEKLADDMGGALFQDKCKRKGVLIPVSLFANGHYRFGPIDLWAAPDETDDVRLYVCEIPLLVHLYT